MVFVGVEEHRGRVHDASLLEEEEMESAMKSASDQREEEMQVGRSGSVPMLQG